MSISTPVRSSFFPSLDQLFDEPFFGGPFRSAWSRGGLTGPSVQPMPLDVYATPDQAVILAAVPGMQPDSLDVTVHQNTVTLTGTRSRTGAGRRAQHQPARHQHQVARRLTQRMGYRRWPSLSQPARTSC